MKKVISLILVVMMLASIFAVGVSATSATPALEMPDWVITEFCPDNKGDGSVGDWADNKDVFEFIEIVNTSGQTLNLYDYCMTYNGNGRSNEKFETVIVEITPFKPGNFLDGSSAEWADGTNTSCTAADYPVNPDTCLVEPGEIVCLWSYYCESSYDLWNSGKGMSIEDFRKWWGISDDVKVIAYDGNSSTGKGGHDKNFNLKNSDVGTYGIALYTEELNTMANTAGSTFPAVYTDYEGLACWATVDFSSQLSHIANQNYSYNFTWDFMGYGATDTNVAANYVPDGRRMIPLEIYCILGDQDTPSTPGKLSTFQKMTLGLDIEAGETIDLNWTAVYIPGTNTGNFEGYIINNVLYPDGSKIVIETAGKYTLDFKYDADNKVVSSVVGGNDTTAGGDDTTAAPGGDDTTAAPGGDDTTAALGGDDNTGGDNTTVAPGGDEGCASVIGFGALVALIPAAFVFRKKED